MRDSATPTRDAPLRRLAFLGLVLVVAALSCAKDVTGPGGARFMRGFSWNPVFPAPLRSVGLSSGVVAFNRVHVVLHHSDSTVALDTMIAFPSTADSVTVSLSVRLLSDAPASGEPMTVDLNYLDAAGDTVFKGGPIALIAAPAPAGGGTNPPVQVPVAYTGPGASATAVAITPHSSTVVAGAGFTLTAAAKDAGGNVLAGTPVVWTSLDPTITTITAPAAGVGVAQAIRGTARIVAQLLTGPADTAQLVVALPASQILKPATASGDAQTGAAGAALTQPISVKVAASDGVGVAGTTVTFAVVAGGGSVAPLTAVSDANGLAQTTWTLGTGAGTPQSVTATAGTFAGSPLTYTATATAAAAAKLAITAQPVSTTAGTVLAAMVVTAQDANGNVAATFTGPVTIALGNTTAGAVLSGTATVNAVAGVATFSTLSINKTFTDYTLVASATGLTSATTSAFNIATGLATTIAASGGTGQTGTINAALPTQIAVHVTDVGGNNVSGTTVTFATTNGSLSPTSAITNASGVASATWTLGSTVGTQSMTATVAGLTPLPITAVGTAVVAGPATQLTFTTQPSNAASGAANSPAIVVHALDANSLLATSFSGNVTLAIGTNPGTSTIGGTITVAAVAGVATFSNVTLNKVGTGYTLTASGTSLTGAMSTAFNITPGLAATLSITGGNSQTATVSTALATPLTVTVTDAAGNAVSGQSVTFAVATGGGSLGTTTTSTVANGQATSTWTLGALVGAQTVTATSTGLIGSPATFTATGLVAGVRTWTGATGTAWATVSNWAPAGIPQTTDSVVVPVVTNLPVMASSVIIKALTLAPGAVLTINGAPLTITGSLDATGTIIGTGGVTLTSATGATIKGTLVQSIAVQGLYTATGALSAGGLQMANSGSLDLNGQAVVIGSSGVSTASTATITMNQAGSTLTTSGGASFGGGDETGKLTAGTLTVGGNFTEGGGNAGAFNAGPAHTLILNGSAATALTMNDPATSIIGNLVITDAAGVTATTGFIVNNLTLSTGTLSGTLGGTINGTLTDPIGKWAAGNISFATSTTPVSASTPAITHVSAITFNNNPSILQGNLTVNGSVNVSGNLQPNMHTLNVTGAFATSGTGQLTMSNPTDLVNVAGSVTFGSSGAGGPMTDGTLSVGGDFTQLGSTQSLSASGNNTVVFNGTGTQTVNFNSPDGGLAGGACSGSCLQNLTASKSAGLLSFSSTVKVLGNFINSNSGSATIQTPAAVTNQSFIVVGNASFGQGGAFHLTGVGGATFSKGAGTTVDSVTYFGGGQPYNPATLGESFSDIRGMSSWTSPGTLTGHMVVDGNGQLNVATSGAVITGNFATVGLGTLKMTTNTTDMLSIGGTVNFGGGVTTTLLTAGTLDVKGNFVASTGPTFDASGSYTTQFSGSAVQTIGWTTPVANVGFKNVLFAHSWNRTFTSDAYIGGTVQIFSSDTGGVINTGVGTDHRITLGGTNTGVIDQSIAQNAWQVGATNFAITGAQLTFLPNLTGVDTTIFSGGGTVALQSNLTTMNVVVDNSTNLNVNGHLLKTQGNSFTTQNGATLQMNAFGADSLDAGFAYFNGGSTATTLTGGGMAVTGLYQGYDPTFTFVPGISSAAFSPSGGLRTWLTGTSPAVAFLNQGTGATYSHFWFVQTKASSGVVLKSDVQVDSLLAGDVTNDIWSSDAPGTTVRTISTKGVNNSGTFGMTMNGVAMALNDGVAISSSLNNVTWTGFPASFTGYVLDVDRTSSAPQINFNNFSAITLGTGGEYINNLGSISLTLGLSNIGGCVLSALAAGGHCP